MSTGKLSGDFYVYHNRQTGPSKAVIHRGSCGHCNHGRGVNNGYDPAHARWSEPFPTLQAAHAYALSLNTQVAPRDHRCI